MASKSKKKIILRIIKWAIIAFVILFIIGIIPEFHPIIDIVVALIAGWAFHITRVFPKITYNPGMIASGIIALTLATYLLHKSLNWFHQQGTLKTPWKPRQTIALTTLLLTLFGMSIAITGIIHQSAWIAKEPRIITSNRATTRTVAMNRAKNIYTDLYFYEKDYKTTCQSLHALVETEGYDPQDILYYRAQQTRKNEPWVYIPTSFSSANPEQIILHTSTPAFNGKWIVMKVNGSVTAMTPLEFQRALQKDKILRKTTTPNSQAK